MQTNATQESDIQVSEASYFQFQKHYWRQKMIRTGPSDIRENVTGATASMQKSPQKWQADRVGQGLKDCLFRIRGVFCLPRCNYSSEVNSQSYQPIMGHIFIGNCLNYGEMCLLVFAFNKVAETFLLPQIFNHRQVL
jgi:hypothetical protein